jgi:hypothetical protein
MSLVSVSLIATWLGLVVLGVTLSGFVHVLMLVATAIVFLSGNRSARRAADAAALRSQQIYPRGRAADAVLK